jgi:hypothetical protein
MGGAFFAYLLLANFDLLNSIMTAAVN